MMNATATKVWNAVQAKFPNQFEFKRKTLHNVAAELGYSTAQYKDLIGDEFKVRKGLYNYASLSPITVKVTEKPAVLSLAKKIDTEVKKAAKKPKSDRTWKGKKIISEEASSEAPAVTTEPSYGVAYVERDGVGYCYRNGEVVSTINYNARKSQ